MTKRLFSFFSVALLSILSGCTTIPFDPEPKADLREADPVAVAEHFESAVATDFELLQSVVFKFFSKGFTGLGYLSIEPEGPAYALSCMTPTGVTLFGLKGDGDTVEPTFVPPQMEKHQDKIFPAIARDLRRVYLDWTPPASADVKHKKDRIIYTAQVGEEEVSWIFSGPEHLLVEKRFKTGWRADCIVSFYDYREQGGKLYPMGVVLYNRSFHYRMIFRVKEIYPSGAGEDV